MLISIETKSSPFFESGLLFFAVYSFVELWYTESHTGEGGDGYSPNLERGEVTGMTFSEVILLLNLLVTVVFGVLNLTLKK